MAEWMGREKRKWECVRTWSCERWSALSGSRVQGVGAQRRGGRALGDGGWLGGVTEKWAEYRVGVSGS